MTDFKRLESITDELIKVFAIQSPPIPIERMLQQPQENMWDELDINKLSGSFLNIKDYYSPRMSLARLLARHIVSSPWGKERGLTDLLTDEMMLRAFARMLMMPAGMVTALSPEARTPERLSIHFEVPLDEAEQRLKELPKPA